MVEDAEFGAPSSFVIRNFDDVIVSRWSAVSAEPVRSVEECIDIFENGPRPVNLSLSVLALHALEKVLDGGAKENCKLKRAVRIRMALLCEFLL